MSIGKVTLNLTPKGSIDEADYADKADLRVRNAIKNKDSWFWKLSMSKLRGIYGQIMNVYTRVNEPADFDANRSDLQYLKVKLAYESGRDKVVEEFVAETGLMFALNCVSTYDQFILYCRYAESLVAYFRFYGGKE